MDYRFGIVEEMKFHQRDGSVSATHNSWLYSAAPCMSSANRYIVSFSDLRIAFPVKGGPVGSRIFSVLYDVDV